MICIQMLFQINGHIIVHTHPRLHSLKLKSITNGLHWRASSNFFSEKLLLYQNNVFPQECLNQWINWFKQAQVAQIWRLLQPKQILLQSFLFILTKAGLQPPLHLAGRRAIPTHRWLRFRIFKRKLSLETSTT